MSRLVTALLFAAIALITLSYNSLNFQGRPYREDEAWRVHYALVNTTVQGSVLVMADNIHPPLWQIVAEGWVHLLGQNEGVTRFLSTLLSCLSLALIFRLGTDLFGPRVGLISAVLLGTLSAFQFYSTEFRPYAAAISATLALELVYLRWLGRPTFTRTLGVVGLALSAIYIHTISLFVLPALFLFTLIFARRGARIYSRALGLFILIGIGWLGWLLPFLQTILVNRREGLTYAMRSENPDTWLALINQNWIRPAIVGVVILLVGIGLFVRSFLRSQGSATYRSWSRFQPSSWQLGYPFVVPAIMFALLLLVNQTGFGVLTPRNLLIVVPLGLIAASYAITRMPLLVQMATLALILVGSLTSFRMLIPAEPYPDMVRAISGQDAQEERRIVIDTGPRILEYIPLSYYLRYRSAVPWSNEQQFVLSRPTRVNYIEMFPEQPAYIAFDDSPETLNHFADFLSDGEQVWYFSANQGVPFNDAFSQILNLLYTPVHQSTFESEFYPFYLTEFRRVPTNAIDRLVFGDRLQLQGETGKPMIEQTSTRPCETVTVERWWSTVAPLTEPTLVHFVLEDSSGRTRLQETQPLSDTTTSQWQADQLRLAQHSVTIPCDASPGKYVLIMGLSIEAAPDDLRPIRTPDGQDQGVMVPILSLDIHP